MLSDCDRATLLDEMVTGQRLGEFDKRINSIQYQLSDTIMQILADLKIENGDGNIFQYT